MKGYYTSTGFMGYMPDGEKILFSTYDEYVEAYKEEI